MMRQMTYLCVGDNVVEMWDPAGTAQSCSSMMTRILVVSTIRPTP